MLRGHNIFLLFVSVGLSLRSDIEITSEVNTSELDGKSNLDTKITQVYASVYDLNDSGFMQFVNTVLLATGGAYHVGIEAFGEEWAYGSGGGIGLNKQPRMHSVHKFYKSVPIGQTEASHEQFHQMIRALQANGEWTGDEYDLLSHNCVSFSKALLASFPERFELPYWTERLMNIGAAVLPPTGAALGSMSRSSMAVSEVAAGSLSAASQVMSQSVTGYVACATQFSLSCGNMQLGENWFQVVCPQNHCCKEFMDNQGGMAATCVSAISGWCPGIQDHLFANNAGGVCR